MNTKRSYEILWDAAELVPPEQYKYFRLYGRIEVDAGSDLEKRLRAVGLVAYHLRDGRMVLVAE